MGSTISLTRPDVDFLITNACPNRCSHCVFCSGKRLPDEMDSAEVVTSLRHIKNVFGIERISISGGEPFSRPDFCHIYIEAARLFSLTLISTGIGADENIFRLLLKHPPRQAIVSLYGMRDYHNTFCQAEGAFESSVRYLEFLNRLRQHNGMNVSVNIVCHRGNINAVPAMLDYLCASNLTDEVKILALSPVGRGRQILQECLSGREWIAFSEGLAKFAEKGSIQFRKGIRIEKHVEDAASSGEHTPRCYVVNDKGNVFSSCVHIDANGEIYPCTMLVRQPEFSLGNILHPARIDHRQCKSLIRKAYARVMQRNCNGCKTRAECLGGCFGYHLANEKDYRCNDGRLRFGCPDRYEMLVAGEQTPGNA